MLTSPSARNKGISLSFILKPFGSFIKRIRANNIPAVTSLKHATWIDVNPRPFRYRTKMPMLPQNRPAVIISMSPSRLFFSIALIQIFFEVYTTRQILQIKTGYHSANRLHYMVPGKCKIEFVLVKVIPEVLENDQLISFSISLSANQSSKPP